jgi:KAP family P-loop domain
MPDDATVAPSAVADRDDRQSIRVLSDTPGASSDDDSLDFLPYAQALAFLIDRKDTHTPLIVAISAPWGAGKTTLAALVQQELQKPGDWDEPHIICSFNAWNHDDAPHLGAAFAADVAQRANQYRGLWRKIIQPLPSAMLTREQAWRRRLYVILFALVVTVLLIFGPNGKILTAAAQPTSENWVAAEHAAHGYGLTVFVLLAALAFVYPKVLSGTQAVARFIKNPQAEAALGSMESVRRQLGTLISQATQHHRRFVIVVDDLERCRPPRAVEVCEVASQLLDHADTVTILVADMEAIAMSAAIKYRELERRDSSAEGESLRAAYIQYGREYLQKLVQIQFDLPPVSREQLKRMLIGDPNVARHISPAAQPARNIENQPRIRSLRGMWRWAISIYVVLILLSIASVVLTLPPKGQTRPAYIGYGLLGVAVIALGVGVVGWAVLRAIAAARARRRARAQREQIDRSIQEQPAGATVDKAVENISPAGTKVGQVSIEKRYLRLAMEQPLVVSRADALVFEFLPRRPRAAKRLLNQVRLMISIAIARGLFVLPGGAGDEMKKEEEKQKELADRVGKWLVLRERWPDVALAAEKDTQLIERLENAARQDGMRELQDCLNSTKISGIEDLDVLRELLEKDPRLGDLSRLAMLSGTPSAVPDLPRFGVA